MSEQNQRDDDFDENRPRRRDDAESSTPRGRRDDDYGDRPRSRRDDFDDDRDYHDRPRMRRRRDYDDDYDDRDPMDDPTMRMLLPVGRSPRAVISGYLGLISVLLIPAPFAIWTGFLAKREMKRDPKLHGMGRAVFGIIMGSIFSVVILILAVLIVVELIQRK